jgi:hypothetical protein
MSTIDEAIQYIRMGNKEEGRQILEELLETDENNAEIWLWLSAVVESDEDREICLENVVALEPDNAVARKGLEALQSGTFNVNDLLSDALEDIEEEEEEDPTTFLDDFMVSEDDDDDLDFDDFGDGSGTKKRGLNVRILVLAVLGLILVVVLGAVGFVGYSRLGSDSAPVSQETPADGQQPGENIDEATATPTPPIDTPTPGPTETVTNTPKPALGLPTAVPTGLPTPTATRVVSPTPG